MRYCGPIPCLLVEDNPDVASERTCLPSSRYSVHTQRPTVARSAGQQTIHGLINQHIVMAAMDGIDLPAQSGGRDRDTRS